MWNDHVVGDVADLPAQPPEDVADRPPHRREVGGLGPGQVGLVGERDHEHLERRTAPEGRHDDDPVVGVDDAMVGRQLGLRRRAQQARLAEPHEPGELLGQLARHERHAEQLAVGVGDRRAGLAPVVDDRLRVPHVQAPSVLLEPVPHRRHDQPGLRLVEVGPRCVVVGAEHEHLVDARGPRLGEDGAEVIDAQLAVAVEGGVPVRNDPDQPLALGSVALERRRRLLLVARAERAGPGRSDLHVELAGREVDGAGRPVGRDRHPAAGERIEPQLAHRSLGRETTTRKLPPLVHGDVHGGVVGERSAIPPAPPSDGSQAGVERRARRVARG